MIIFPPSPAGSSSSSSSTSSSSSLRRNPLFYISAGSAIVVFSLILLSVERRGSWHRVDVGLATTALINDQCSGENGRESESESSLSNQQSTIKKVCDPHDLPGTLHLSPENLDSIPNALKTEWRPINSIPSLSTTTHCPPQHYIQHIAAAASALAGTSSSIPTSLFNRTILLIGDSIDRGNAQYTCHLLQGHYSIIGPDYSTLWPQNKGTSDSPIFDRNGNEWHPNEYSPRSFPTLCQVASIDLVIVNVFHFGLDQDGYFEWKDQYGPPYATEERIEEIAVPLVQKLARKIDILEFSSGLWDLARFGRQDDDALTAESSSTVRHLTPERLEWFSSRFASVLTRLSEAFPSSSSSSPSLDDNDEEKKRRATTATTSATTDLASKAQRYVRRLHSASDDDAGSFQQWWQVSGGGAKGEKHTYYFPSWRIWEINAAMDAAVAAVNLNLNRNLNTQQTSAHAHAHAHGRPSAWDVDRWGDKLAGMELFDKGNVHPHFAATTLWLEQMFYRLVNGR